MRKVPLEVTKPIPPVEPARGYCTVRLVRGLYNCAVGEIVRVGGGDTDYIKGDVVLFRGSPIMLDAQYGIINAAVIFGKHKDFKQFDESQNSKAGNESK